MNECIIILKKLGKILELNNDIAYLEALKKIEAGNFSKQNIMCITTCIINFYRKATVKSLNYFTRRKMNDLYKEILKTKEPNKLKEYFISFVKLFSKVNKVEFETSGVNEKHVTVLSGGVIVTLAILMAINSGKFDIAETINNEKENEKKDSYSNSLIIDGLVPKTLSKEAKQVSETISFGENEVLQEDINLKIENATNILYNEIVNLNLGYEYTDIKSIIEVINGIENGLSLDDVSNFFKNLVEFNSVKAFTNALTHNSEYISPINLECMFIKNTKGIQGLKDLIYIYNSLNSNPYDKNTIVQALNINYKLLVGNGLYKGLNLNSAQINSYIRLLAIKIITANNAVITACNQVESIEVDGCIILTSDLVDCHELDNYEKTIHNKEQNKTLKLN